MAFGFFKKNEVADIIFTGGKIYTQDSDLPWAEAVACAGGKIIAVGDSEAIMELESTETEVVDLEGGTMLPGFIDTHGHPVARAFCDSYIQLDENADLDEILGFLTDYVDDHDYEEQYFAMGFNESAIHELDKEERRATLDAVCMDKPIVAVSSSGLSVWLNNCALELAQAAAEEEKVKMITLPYILSIINAVDFEAVQEKVIDITSDYCDRGFTSIFDCGSFEYFDNVYQDMLIELHQEGLLKQRQFGSLLINKEINAGSVLSRLAQKRTNCIELEEGIYFDTLKLIISENDKETMSGEYLNSICMSAADAGFNIHIDAMDKKSVLSSVSALSAARTAGYKKNSFVIAHEEILDSDDRRDTSLGEDMVETVPTIGDINEKYRCIENAKNISHAIDMLTIDAAIMLGRENEIGAIKAGMLADFVIFDENPLEALNLGLFKRIRAVMTVRNGEIVYDAEEDNMSELYNLMANQQM